MVYELKEFTPEIFDNLLKEIKGRKNKTVVVEQSIDGVDSQKSACSEGEKKTLAKHYGCLKRGYDGMEYQRAVRYGWD